MVAMSVTAISFGRMATVYPSSGSVYTYISRGMNPQSRLHRRAGRCSWNIFFSRFKTRSMRCWPFSGWCRRFPSRFGGNSCRTDHHVTVQGIKFTARTNEVLLGFMVLVTAVFLVEAFRFIVLHDHLAGLFSMQPIYDPATFNCGPWPQARRSPRWCSSDSTASQFSRKKWRIRNETSCSHRCWSSFLPDFSAACRFISRSACGRTTRRCKTRKRRSWTSRESRQRPDALHGVRVMLLVSSIACGLAGHVGAARLLYSMGRDDVLPKKIFGYISRKKRQSDLQRLDCGRTCVHRRADDSVGTRRGNRNVRRTASVHGREYFRIAPFLFFA